MDNLDLNNQEQAQLAALVAETEAARLRAIRRVAAQVEKSRVKETVDDKEYVKRLERSLKRDQVVVGKVSEERIERSLKTWKERVGPTFAGATTDIPMVVDRVNRLSTKSGKHKTSLVAYGSIGVGKSWTAYAYINMAIASGAVTTPQIVTDTETGVLGKITVSGYKKPEMLEELMAPRNKIWFIDDVGQGFFSDAQKRTEVWFELVDHIYTHQLTLLLTTNLNPSQLEKWVGPRAFDRIKTLCGSDGWLEPSKVNRRSSVLESNEEKFLGKQNGFNG